MKQSGRHCKKLNFSLSLHSCCYYKCNRAELHNVNVKIYPQKDTPLPLSLTQAQMPASVVRIW